VVTSRRARFLVAGLVFGMMGLWLNGCAVFVTVGASGGPALGQPLVSIVYLACIPMILAGYRADQWPGSGLGLVFLNVAGWTLIGLAAAGCWEILRRYIDDPKGRS
jgi:hypothetical protein